MEDVNASTSAGFRRLGRCALGIAAIGLFMHASSGVARGVDGPADANKLIERMREALEPGNDMRASFDLEITNPGESVHWVGTFYRRSGPDARTRMMFDAPTDLRGTQVSISRDRDGLTHTRMYLPLVRRIRDLQAHMRGESFLGTDFTYEDLGLEPLNLDHPTIAGDCQVEGRAGERVESGPVGRSWYGKVIRCIDQQTFLPLRTEYFDQSAILWKVRTFSGIKTIGGHPVATEIRMETVPAHSSTQLRFTDVIYDSRLPDSVFDIVPTEQRAGEGATSGPRAAAQVR